MPETIIVASYSMAPSSISAMAQSHTVMNYDTEQVSMDPTVLDDISRAIQLTYIRFGRQPRGFLLGRHTFLTYTHFLDNRRAVGLLHANMAALVDPPHKHLVQVILPDDLSFAVEARNHIITRRTAPNGDAVSL
jgi:hypothetical protein